MADSYALVTKVRLSAREMNAAPGAKGSDLFKWVTIPRFVPQIGTRSLCGAVEATVIHYYEMD
jgi:hypothetical protein